MPARRVLLPDLDEMRRVVLTHRLIDDATVARYFGVSREVARSHLRRIGLRPSALFVVPGPKPKRPPQRNPGRPHGPSERAMPPDRAAEIAYTVEQRLVRQWRSLTEAEWRLVTPQFRAEARARAILPVVPPEENHRVA